MTPDDLVAKVWEAIVATSDAHTASVAAVRVVVEACAEIAESKSTSRCMTYERKTKGSCGEDIAKTLRALAPPEPRP